MLEPQIVVNLLPEFGVGANLVRRDCCFGETVGHDAGRLVQFVLLVTAFCSETYKFHTSTSTMLPRVLHIGPWSYTHPGLSSRTSDSIRRTRAREGLLLFACK